MFYLEMVRVGTEQFMTCLIWQPVDGPIICRNRFHWEIQFPRRHLLVAKT